MVGNNALSSFPAALATNLGLKLIDVSYNNFISTNFLPSLCNLTSLQASPVRRCPRCRQRRLALQAPPRRSLQQASGSVLKCLGPLGHSLQVLDVSGNGIRNPTLIDGWLCPGMTNLTRLIMDDNPMGSLPLNLTQIPNLAEL